ncbi:type IV toxin-antitoxin system AbiEi family antitoxin domain-containing protein [Nocardioides sp. AE5]|uniref:type IV toxin-antitoxin system AbiEi family antitoxin domain-containing protein n=1 Tax=Nocardioides sp. AE5 TaxID=2962573 RepID=UPI0028827C6E|nr:type IV toxin-antitoxin system AbiEi family antitoxin domain-containing protein [Nocardioides sp. AE5]MDT0202664.1 type IV toxin-antitoxin system AbiEi family antitoxin domain-containing protein [Nocardioides sp. AE5]
MDTNALSRLVEHQAGVVSRRQLVAHGASDNDITRLLRRRQLARVGHGTYVTHTGPLTRLQREWVAVLRHHPAALSGVSALAAWKVRGPWVHDERIHLLVDESRRTDASPGVLLTRSQHYDRIARTDLSPPRVALEPAVLLAASSATTETSSIAVLADVCQQRRTTPPRLRDALDLLPRLPGRRLFSTVLDDVASGAHSVLERVYLRDVERAHGLPRAERQVPIDRGAFGRRGRTWRDVEHREYGVVVELDGRLGHEWSSDRWQDLTRDLVTASRLEMTVRVGWGMVMAPCRLAAGVAAILRARGWRGQPVACGAGCTVGEWKELGGKHAPGA